VGGTIEERLQKISEIYQLKPVISIEQAVSLAKKEAQNYNIVQEGK